MYEDDSFKSRALEIGVSAQRRLCATDLNFLPTMASAPFLYFINSKSFSKITDMYVDF